MVSISLSRIVSHTTDVSITTTTFPRTMTQSPEAKQVKVNVSVKVRDLPLPSLCLAHFRLPLSSQEKPVLPPPRFL